MPKFQLSDWQRPTTRPGLPEPGISRRSLCSDFRRTHPLPSTLISMHNDQLLRFPYTALLYALKRTNNGLNVGVAPAQTCFIPPSGVHTKSEAYKKLNGVLRSESCTIQKSSSSSFPFGGSGYLDIGVYKHVLSCLRASQLQEEARASFSCASLWLTTIGRQT